MWRIDIVYKLDRYVCRMSIKYLKYIVALLCFQTNKKVVNRH